MTSTEIISLVLFGISEILPFLPVNMNSLLDGIINVVKYLLTTKLPTNSSTTDITLPKVSELQINMIKQKINDAVSRNVNNINMYIPNGLSNEIKTLLSELGYTMTLNDHELVIEW